MSGVIFVVLAALAVMFVCAPLGLSVWFGLDYRVVLLNQGFRLQATLVLLAYYAMNLYLAWRAFRARRRWPFGALMATLWLGGFLGFLRVYGSFAR